MATFGRYEQVREIAVTGTGSVWTARLADSTHAYVVKTYQPAAGVLADDQVEQGIRSFLECARAQQQAAASTAPLAAAVPDASAPGSPAAPAAPGATHKDTHWAPVHESGEFPGGAYYVTDHYPWSVKRLTAGRVAVDAAGLYAIATGVAGGLARIKDCCGRPHGNLTASNVLLDGPPGAASTRVFLADPADPADPRRVGGDGAEANDLYALGRILFELITHRQARRMMQWPIPPGPEWAALAARGDAKGDGWRDLCNQLLHPVPEESLRRLDDLQARLAALAAGGKRPGKPRLLLVGAAAAAVLVLSAGSAAYFLGVGRHKQVVVIPPQPPQTGFVDGTDKPHPPPTQPTTEAEAAARESARKAFEQWQARIAPPTVESPALRKAWEEARRAQLAGRTAPDPAVKSRLEDLREDLQSLERDLSTVNAAGTADAAAAREGLYAKAARAVAEDPSASDPAAAVWHDLRDEYGRWIKRQGDVRRAEELVKAAGAEHGQGHDRAALNKLEEALAADGANAGAKGLKRRIEDGEAAALAEAKAAAEQGGDLPGVLTRLGELLGRDPDLSEAKRLSLSISSRMDGAKADETMLRSALDQHLQGNDGAALATLEQLLARSGQNKEAKAARAQILKVEGQMLADAGALEEAGRLEEAAKVLGELLGRNPSRPDAAQVKRDVEKKLALGLLGEARAKAGGGDWAGALGVLDRVDGLVPGNADAVALRRDVDRLVQNHEKVVRLLAEGETLQAQAPPDWKRAVDAFKEAAGLEKDNQAARDRLAAASEGLKAYEEKQRHDTQVIAALAKAQGQITAGELDAATSTLAGIDPNLPDAQKLLQDIKGKREEREKAVLAGAGQQAASGDLDGAAAALRGLDPNRPDVRPLLQDIQARREQRERDAQAAAAARAGQLAQLATMHMKAGDPSAAMKDLQAAENERVRAAVKPMAEKIQAAVSAAAAQCKQGDALFDKRQYNDALEAYLRAAEGGSAEAMLHLGGLYLNGLGSSKNPTEAATWFQRAADRRVPDAMYQLATLYDKGQGVTPNASTATGWYQQAASAGNAAAKELLAKRAAAAAASAGTGGNPGTSKPPMKPVGVDLIP